MSRPRKPPTQARAAETRGAICEAAMQLLLKFDWQGLTTIQISKRAGVSVGTYYQYFPNKEALLYSLVDQHLSQVSKTLQETCKQSHGKSLRTMVAAFLEAYVAAQLAQWNAARVVYRLALQIDTGAVLARERALVVASVARMLGTCPVFRTSDLDLVALTFFGAVSGATRAWLEKSPQVAEAKDWETHVGRLALAYLESVAIADFGPEANGLR